MRLFSEPFRDHRRRIAGSGCIGDRLGIGLAGFYWRVGCFCHGSVVFGLGGLPWAAVLLTFFISSSLLSILFKSHKIESEKYAAKGLRRDAGQVLANGGLAGLAVIVYGFFPKMAGPGWVSRLHCGCQRRYLGH